MEERKNKKPKSREDRFKQVAERRVKEILHKMKLLGNCANKANYSYNEKQAKKIINTIEEEWKGVKHEFNKNKPKRSDFSLD